MQRTSHTTKNCLALSGHSTLTKKQRGEREGKGKQCSVHTKTRESLDLGEEESANDTEEQRDGKKTRSGGNQGKYFTEERSLKCRLPLRSHEAVTEDRSLSLLHGSHGGPDKCSF